MFAIIYEYKKKESYNMRFIFSDLKLINFKLKLIKFFLSSSSDIFYKYPSYIVFKNYSSKVCYETFYS